jgi:hypothetical protein
LDRFCILIVTAGSILVALTGESIMGLLDIQLSLAMCALFVPLAMGVFGKPLGQLSGLLPMLLGLTAWLLREGFQRFLVPISRLEELQESDPAQYADMLYPSFVESELGQSLFGNLATYYASIPADIQGLVASILGYFIAQGLIRFGWATKTEYIAEEI